jgi:hypothetical protein
MTAITSPCPTASLLIATLSTSASRPKHNRLHSGQHADTSTGSKHRYQHRLLTQSLQNHSGSHGSVAQVLQSGQPCNNLLAVLLNPKGLLLPKSPASTLRVSHLISHTAPVYMQQTFIDCIQQLSGSSGVWTIKCYWPCSGQKHLSQSMKWQTLAPKRFACPSRGLLAMD